MLFKEGTGIVNMKTQNKHRLNIHNFFPSMFCVGFPFYKRSVLPSRNPGSTSNMDCAISILSRGIYIVSRYQ